MTTAVALLASRFKLGNAEEATAILKNTAFKGGATDAQMAALCVVAQQYGLNPFTREIYAFPDRNNGIVPVVGVDGWARIINEHAQFDGMSFEQDEDSCTCVMYRKDRAHPIKVTEYLTECRREVAPWKSHPKRMLRHKALIQCARLAFGFVGIHDQDEAERIVESEAIDSTARRVTDEPEVDELLQPTIDAASAAAAQGVASYENWFKSFANKRQKRALAASKHHAANKEAATAADAAKTPEEPAKTESAGEVAE